MINRRGFTLLIAIILSTVTLTVGLALLDIAYKHIVLATTAKASEVAFYNADSALECALYYDQQQNFFDYSSGLPAPGTGILCNSLQVTNYNRDVSSSIVHITSFTVPCAGGGVSATSTIYKYQTGASTLYANGFNTCNSNDPGRIERGLKAQY
jgi:hypothetical protein